MEDQLLHGHTRLLLEAARSINQANKPLEALAKSLRLNVEAIEHEIDTVFNTVSIRISDKILELNGFDPEDLQSTGALSNIVSGYMFDDESDIDSCLLAFREKIKEIKRNLE